MMVLLDGHCVPDNILSRRWGVRWRRAPGRSRIWPLRRPLPDGTTAAARLFHQRGVLLAQLRREGCRLPWTEAARCVAAATRLRGREASPMRRHLARTPSPVEVGERQRRGDLLTNDVRGQLAGERRHRSAARTLRPWVQAGWTATTRSRGSWWTTPSGWLTPAVSFTLTGSVASLLSPRRGLGDPRCRQAGGRRGASFAGAYWTQAPLCL